MEWVKAFSILIGRILLVLIFLQSGVIKIGNFEGKANYMANSGMPYKNFFLVGAILFELIGSLAVILGCFTRFGTLLILIFLIPTILIFHTHFSDRMQMIQFMKNLSMFGGGLILLASGPGRWSLDHFLRERRT